MYYELIVNNVFFVVLCSLLDYELLGFCVVSFFLWVLFCVLFDGFIEEKIFLKKVFKFF